jgi:hypothetical protein
MALPSKQELERFSDEAAKLLSRREESGTPVAQRHTDRFEAVVVTFSSPPAPDHWIPIDDASRSPPSSIWPRPIARSPTGGCARRPTPRSRSPTRRLLGSVRDSGDGRHRRARRQSTFPRQIRPLGIGLRANSRRKDDRVGVTAGLRSCASFPPRKLPKQFFDPYSENVRPDLDHTWAVKSRLR